MNAAKLTKKYMMLIVLILLIVFFTIFGENFLSVENAITVCRQVSIIGICATGMMFALLTAHIDLSIGATVSFAAVFWAKLISTNEGIMMNPYLAMLVVLFFCVIIGTTNGLLVVKTNMPALIATMATSTVLEGVNYLITDAKPIIESLIANGRVTGRAMLGISAVAVSAVEAQKSGVPLGLWVKGFSEGADIAAKGVRVDDIITHIAGTPIYSVSGCADVLEDYAPGDTITVTVFRRSGAASSNTFDVDIVLMGS